MGSKYNAKATTRYLSKKIHHDTLRVDYGMKAFVHLKR